MPLVRDPDTGELVKLCPHAGLANMVIVVVVGPVVLLRHGLRRAVRAPR